MEISEKKELEVKLGKKSPLADDSSSYTATVFLTIMSYIVLVVLFKWVFKQNVVDEIVESAGIWGELFRGSTLFIGAGTIGWFAAKEKKRNSWLWAMLCVFFQVFGIIIIALISYNKEETLPQTKDDDENSPQISNNSD